MKKVIVLLIVGLWVTSCLGVVAAQEMLVAPDGEEPQGLTPDLALPPMSDSDSDGEFEMQPHDGSWQSDEGDTEQLEPYAMDEYDMFPCDPALLESTGTWIRRGFWYTEIDAVIFNRKWNRDPIVLIQQPVGNSSSVIQPNSLIFNQLLAQGAKPGSETAPRLTLGRFLFRDHRNRDHVGEFTIFGGGQWSQEALLNANPNNNLGSTVLLVPVETDDGDFSFDGATSSEFRYDSRFNSFELNYHVKDRMGRDHLELEPSGHWVRRAGPSVSRSLLAGLRYFNLNEGFDWTASGIDTDNDAGTPGEDGSIRIETDNNMFGTQLGFSWNYETARWSGGLRAKGGMFVNNVDVKFDSVVPVADSSVVSDAALAADEFGFIGEAAVIGKWHLRPNFSLRVGFETLFLTSTALAPHQISFIPGGPTGISSSGDATYLGGSIGFEGYW